jgi:hypothetical protein
MYGGLLWEFRVVYSVFFTLFTQLPLVVNVLAMRSIPKGIAYRFPKLVINYIYNIINRTEQGNKTMLGLEL